MRATLAEVRGWLTTWTPPRTPEEVERDVDICVAAQRLPLALKRDLLAYVRGETVPLRRRERVEQALLKELNQ
jgi:hypothetical protein